MSGFSRPPVEVAARMISLIGELDRQGSVMNRARAVVLKFHVGHWDGLTDAELEFARGIEDRLQEVAIAQGYYDFSEVPESRRYHAFGLLCALEVTNVRQSDPPVASYLEQRVEEHLTPDDNDDEYEDDDEQEESEEPPAYAIGTVVRPLRGGGTAGPPEPRSEAQAGMSELLARIGGSSRHDPATGDTVLAWRGTDMVRINSRRTPAATWVNAAIGTFLTRVMEYNGLVKGLQDNRGFGTAGLRQLLRENLSVDVLVAEARSAGASVEQTGVFSTKRYYFSHPLMGQFLEATVPRGQNHVIEVAFDSPDTFKPISFLVAFVMKSNGAT